MDKLLQTDLNREKGFIYFVKNDPLELWRAQRGRKKKVSETSPPANSEKPPEPEPKKEEPKEEQPEPLKIVTDDGPPEEPIPF